MARKKPSTTFHPVFEMLESRELMAADLGVAASGAFLASGAHADAAANFHEVGGSVFFRLPLSSSTTFIKTTPAPAPKVTPPPAPPVTPAPPVAPTPANPNVSWANANLHDAAVRSLVDSDLASGMINRADMLALFTQVEKDGTINSTEFNDLKTLVAKSSLFSGFDYVDALAADVVNGNLANAHYQGTSLGNLNAGSSATQMQKLVDKWFLGEDHPATMSGVTYVQATGSLFPHAPVYTDIRQGALGDCYLLSSLAETALISPSTITNMFITNGDGTYTVRFNHNGKTDYVTVDSMLPVDSHGYFVYADFGQKVSDHSVPLWAALVEKAYAQMNESGWLRADLGDTGGHNTYAAISAGNMTDALNQITGRATAYSGVSSTTFATYFNSGQLITFGTVAHPADSSVVGNHAYAVISYNKSTGQVTLFNPWGINNGAAPGLVTLSWAQLKNDFFGMEYTT